MRLPPAERLRPWVIGALILLKLGHAAWTTRVGVDGGYYLDVAQHVRDGHGLVTDASLYHAAMPIFPHPTPIPPLWPLLLGTLARLAPMGLLDSLLPSLLWIVALISGERLARRLRPGPLGHPAFDAGLLFALGFGLNEELLRVSSQPYTEPLALALLVGVAWRVRAFAAAPGALGALELGAWAGALLLTRAQLLVAVLALTVLFAGRLVLGPGRGRAAGQLGLYALGAALVLAPWVAWLSTFTPVSPSTLLSFQTWQAAPGLRPVAVASTSRDLAHWLARRGEGLALAFHPSGPYSWHHAVGYLQYAVFPAALVVLRQPGRLRARLGGPEGAALGWLLLVGLGTAAQLHLLHKANFSTWNFGTRHALPTLALWLPAVAVLLGAGRLARALGVGLLVLSLGHQVGKTWLRRDTLRASASIARRDEAAIGWVRAQPAAFTAAGVAVMDPRAQALARRADGIGWHWVYERTTRADLDALAARGVRLLLVPARDHLPGQDDAAGFAAAWPERPDPPEGWRAFGAR